MYLVDTNIWLERLLNQERADEVAQFLHKIPSERLMITDFTFHSIGVILSRHDEQETLQRFTQDVLIDSAVTLVSLGPTDMQRLIETMTEYQFDFDDAYQYVAAEKYGAELISFDSDFDQAERRRKTPLQILTTNGSFEA
jgi:hypothetical protein